MMANLDEMLEWYFLQMEHTKYVVNVDVLQLKAAQLNLNVNILNALLPTLL
jgi:hypothetical protein